MKKTLTMIAFLMAIPGGAALGDEACYVPLADWQPRAAVERMAAEKGWTIRRIRIDDGCYEIDGQDGQGRRIAVKVHPGTLEVMGIAYRGEREGIKRELQEGLHD